MHLSEGQISVCPYTLGDAWAIPVEKMELFSETNVRMIIKMECSCQRSSVSAHAWLISPLSQYTLVVPNTTALQTKRLALHNFGSPPAKRITMLSTKSDQESFKTPMSCTQTTFATTESFSRPSSPGQARTNTPTNSVKSFCSSRFGEYEVYFIVCRDDEYDVLSPGYLLNSSRKN